MTRGQARERILETIEDAQVEIAHGRWGPVYPLLREAADMARALTKTTTVRVLPVAARNGKLEGDPRYSQSLERGLAILALFTVDQPIWQLAEIADKLGYARSTTHRYLLTLVALGQVEQTTGRRYRRADA